MAKAFIALTFLNCNLIWYSQIVCKIPSHQSFQFEVKKGRRYYNTCQFFKYPLCTNTLQNKFQLVIDLSLILQGIKLVWTQGICTKIILRSLMSLVHKHYHFKYYYCLILQWLYISMALFLGCCIFVAIEFALLIPYLFVVFKNWFTWLQTGCLKKYKKKKRKSLLVYFFMLLHVGAKQISGEKSS